MPDDGIGRPGAQPTVNVKAHVAAAPPGMPVPAGPLALRLMLRVEPGPGRIWRHVVDTVIGGNFSHAASLTESRRRSGATCDRDRSHAVVPITHDLGRMTRRRDSDSLAIMMIRLALAATGRDDPSLRPLPR